MTRKTSIITFFIFCVSLVVLRGDAYKTLYVSPFGSDQHTGTFEKPFKSLPKARDAVRKINGEAKGDIIIYLRGGQYPINETIELDHRDSGSNGNRIIYRAHPGEKPVISGGVKIEGWEPHKNGIWKAPAHGLNFRQFYVNGKRAVRSREPDQGDYYRLKAWDVEGKRFMIDPSHISEWNNFQSVEMVLQQYWAESYLRLKSFFTSGSVSRKVAYLHIQDEERDILFPRPYPQKADNQAFHFENAYEFLDQPGEWYLDHSKNTVYYKPPASVSMTSINAIAPVVTTLLAIQGTLDKPVKNLLFEGITFEHSTWTYPSEHGYMNMQAGQYNLRAEKNNDQWGARPPAGVLVAGAKFIRFHRNTFRHMGATGIDFFYGTQNCEIEGNLITDISGNGISIGKFMQDPDTEYHVPYNPEDPREICTNDAIRNNVVYKTGRDFYGACSIAAGYPAGLKIEHNIIRDNPYTGISVGYGWTYEPNAMRDNLIANNSISNVMTLLADGAAIYTLSLQPGTRIVENHIHQVKRSKWAGSFPVAGIYLDHASGGTEEKPFVLKHNFIDDIREEHNLHRPGTVVIDYDYFYESQEGALQVKERAGLEEEYKDLGEHAFQNNAQRSKSRDLVLTTELKNEEEAIEQYEYFHSTEGVWPEVVHAARVSGIESIRIYRHDNRLVMILTIPADKEIAEINRQYADSSSRIPEWENLMSRFFMPPQERTTGKDIWAPMRPIHHYENGNVIPVQE